MALIDDQLKQKESPLDAPTNVPSLSTDSALSTPKTVKTGGALGEDKVLREPDISQPSSLTAEYDKLISSDNPLIKGARTRAAQAANQSGLINSSMAVQAGEMAAHEAAMPIALQSLRGTQAKELAGIEANYRTQIQTSDSASKLYQQMVDSMNKTLQSDLSPEAKTAAIKQQTEMLRSGLNILGKINNLDLTSLLDFSQVDANAPTNPNAKPQEDPQWLKDLYQRLEDMQRTVPRINEPASTD